MDFNSSDYQTSSDLQDTCMASCQIFNLYKDGIVLPSYWTVRHWIQLVLSATS